MLASGEAQKVWIQPPWSRVAWMAGRRGADAQIGAVLREGVRAARGLLPPSSLQPQRWRHQNQLGNYQENDNSKRRIAATRKAAAARGIGSASVLSSRFQRTWWNVVGRSKRAVTRRLVRTEHNCCQARHVTVRVTHVRSFEKHKEVVQHAPRSISARVRLKRALWQYQGCNDRRMCNRRPEQVR